MADNRRVIIGIDLDAARAIKSAASLEARIVKLTEETKTNRKAISEQNKQVEKTAIASSKATERLNEAVKVYGANSSEARKLRAEVGRLDVIYSDQQKRLNLLSQQQVTYKETIKSARKEQRILSREMSAVPGSLAQQRAELIRLKNEYANFSVGVNGSEKELNELSGRIKSLTRDISRQEQRIGVFGRNVGNYTQSIKNAFSGVANILTGGLLIGGISGITSAIGNLADESIRLFDKQAKADAQLRASLESTRGAAGRTFEELKEQATGLQGLTLFGDEQVQQAQGLLLTFTNVQETTFDRATELTLDYAQALANASGGTADLRSASLAVGKALNDPVKGLGALSRAGVQFTEGQKDAVKSLVETGETAEAQRIILQELEKQFGGSAEAAAQAGAGGLQQLQNKIGDVKEEIGNQLLPVQEALTRAQLRFFQGLAKGVELGVKFVGVLREIPGFIKDNREEILALTIALISFNAQAIAATANALRQAAAQRVAAVATRAFTVAQAFLNTVMSLNPIGLVVAAIGALSAAFVIAYKRSEKFRAVVQGTFAALKNVVGNFVDAVKNQVVGIGNVIAGAFTFDLDRLKAGISQLGEGIKGQFTAIGKGTAEAFQDGYAGEIERSKMERARKAAAEALDMAQPAKDAGQTAGGAFLNGLNDALSEGEVGIQASAPAPVNPQALEVERTNLQRQIELKTEFDAEKVTLEKALLDIEEKLAIASAKKKGEDITFVKAIYDAKRVALEAEYLKETKAVALKEVEARVKEEVLKENARFEQRRQALAESRATELITEEEYRQRLEDLEFQHNLNLLTIQAETIQAQLDTELLGENERLEALAELAAIEAEIAAQGATAIEEAEQKKRAEKAKTIEQERKEAEERARNADELGRYRDTFIRDVRNVTQEVIRAFGEETAAAKAAFAIQKAAAVAQIGIDTQEQISAALTTGERINALVPIAAPFLGIAYTVGRTALALGQGAARITAIQSQRFDTGGAVGESLARLGGMAYGPSHEFGGIPGTVQGTPIEFEGGEYIVRKEATARNSDVIRQVNEDAGRSRFALVKMFKEGGRIIRPATPMRFESGGAVSQPVAAEMAKEAIGAAEVAEIVRATVSSMPAPEVSVKEIAEVGRRVSVKEGRAKL